MSGVRTAVLMTPRPEGSSSAVEVDAELVVPIANNETRSLAERRAVAELLRCPLLGGSPRYGHVHDFARAEIDDEEGEDGPEPDVVSQDEIAGPDVMGVVFEEGRPALAGAARPEQIGDQAHERCSGSRCITKSCARAAQCAPGGGSHAAHQALQHAFVNARVASPRQAGDSAKPERSCARQGSSQQGPAVS